MICSKCGNGISNDSKFCDKCGNKITSKNNKLKPTQKLCNRCGGVISKDAIFCYKCGNNTGSVKSDEITGNNTEKSNVQIDEVSKVENNASQSTEEQRYNSPNVNTRSKIIKNRKNHTLIRLCAIAVFLVIVEESTSGYGINTNKYTDNNIQTKTQTKTTKTSYNGIQLPNTYTNEDEGVCFNYPKSWEEDSSLKSKYNAIVYLKAQQGQNTSAYMGVTKVNKVTDGFDLSNAISDLEEFWDESDIEIQEMIDTNIDGVDAIKVTGSTVQGTTVVAYRYIINGYCYQITFNALDNKFDVYESIFDAIIESYKITAPRESTSQKQNTDEYGLSEEEALEVAQDFVDTHPLMERTITGNVLYEPQSQTFSTKGLYWLEMKAPDGSRRAMWVDKRTGSILFSTDNTTLRDGEEVYEEMFVSNQDNGEILFNGRKISNYLGNRVIYIYDDFGQDMYGTDVGGSLYDNYKYIGYDGISFLYDDSSNIQRICGKPELFTYNGVTLNKNCDELDELFGTPLVEDSRYDNSTGKSNYWVDYNKDNYTIRFEFSSEDSDAYLIQIYK